MGGTLTALRGRGRNSTQTSRPLRAVGVPPRQLIFQQAMPLRIKCPSGHSLIVSESRAGQTFRCPKCQAEVRVPPKELPAPPDEHPARVKPPAPPQVKKPFASSAPVLPPPAPLAKEALPPPKSATLAVPAPTTPAKAPVPPPLPEAAAKEVPVSKPSQPVAPPVPVPEPEPAAPPPHRDAYEFERAVQLLLSERSYSCECSDAR